MNVPIGIKAAVRLRSDNRCEYCRLPMSVMPEPFHIEHVVARCHGGETALHNLAFSCSRCNFHKGTNLSGIDPDTREVVLLFNPRKNGWSDHFERRGSIIKGKTKVGRASVSTCSMNGEDRVVLRSLLIEDGMIPSEE